MATFEAAARVRVTDESSAYRGKFGTVESRDDNNHQVRIDGYPVGNTVLLLGEQLQSSTQPCPIDYSNS
jgi:hypothetical protein